MVPNTYALERLVHDRQTEDRHAAAQQRTIYAARLSSPSGQCTATHRLRQPNVLRRGVAKVRQTWVAVVERAL